MRRSLSQRLAGRVAHRFDQHSARKAASALAADPVVMDLAKALFRRIHFNKRQRGKLVYDAKRARLVQRVNVAWEDYELNAALDGEGDPLGLVLGTMTRFILVVFTVSRRLRTSGRGAFIDGEPTPRAQRALRRVNRASGLRGSFSFVTDGGFAVAYAMDEEVPTADAVQFMSEKLAEARLPSDVIRARVSATSSAPFFVPSAASIRSADLGRATSENLAISENAASLIPQSQAIAPKVRSAEGPTPELPDAFFASASHAFSSYFSGSRQQFAERFFAHLVDHALRSIQGPHSRFGVNTFALPSRLAAAWYSRYRAFLDVLMDLGMIESATGYSSGSGCNTAMSARYVLHRVIPQEFDRASVFASLRTTDRPHHTIADALGINERTLRRWSARPEAVAPSKVIRLAQVLR